MPSRAFRKSRPNTLSLLMMGTASLLVSACNSSGGEPAGNGAPVGVVSQTDPVPAKGNPDPAQLPTQTPPQSRGPRQYETGALVFSGPGTWQPEVSSLEDILASHGVTYQDVGADELNRMSLDEISKFGMIVMPGGTGSEEASSLSPETRTHLRQAVRERGVSWIGFCAGAFVAIAPTPAVDKDPSYGIGIVDGPVLDYYYLENEMTGVDIAMVKQSFPNGQARDIVWYGGPVTPGGQGVVVSRYPNGDPAISQLWSGNGFVVISATHPTAPQSIRDELGLQDSDGLDFELAWQLFDAALNRRPLPAF